jgi:Tol biopolymer transport system component
VNGGKDEATLVKSSAGTRDTNWSRDGRFLLYSAIHPERQHDIFVLPLQGDKKPVPFLATRFNEIYPRFSPDGHWMAYTSNESGRYEVYVRSFSMNADETAVEPGGKWQISTEGGASAPHWRSDGRELYFRSNRRIMAVEITTSPAFHAGKPQPLPGIPPGAWDCTADGKRFLVMVPKNGGPEPYTVVLNWQAGLKK